MKKNEEIDALGKIIDLLEPLGVNQSERIAIYLIERYVREYKYVIFKK